MIAKCTYCGGALKYDAEIHMLVCEYCLGMFPVEKTEEEKLLSQESDEQDRTRSASFINDLPKAGMEEMECSIYKCQGCGAELVINDVEAATYCAYCGQPSVVFDRIAKRRRPKYIIPFSISKNAAIVNIRKRFLKGGFVPKEIKYFNPDVLRGIYVPYMLYNVRCRSRQLIRSNILVSNAFGSDTKTHYCYRDAEAVFSELPADASSRISNEFTERLEPYYLNAMVEFKAEYLSGFYADLEDDDFVNLKQLVKKRTVSMTNDRIIKTVPGQDKALLKSKFSHIFEKESYALFPVWFMQFHREDETYTIMVNGQTGKVVATMPSDRIKVFLFFFLSAIFFSTLGFYLFPMFWLTENLSIPITLTLTIPALFIGGIRKLRGLNSGRRFTSGTHIKKFVKERQDDQYG